MFCFFLSKGPTDEELCLTEEDHICLERDGRRRRREDEQQRWQERLQENWENCLVRMRRSSGWRGDGEPDLSHLSPPLTHALSLSLALFLSGAESVLPGLRRPLPAGELPAHPPPPDPCGETPACRQLSHRPEFGAPAEV